MSRGSRTKIELTQDAFLGGRISVSQPAKGFRAGLDSVLLAAAVSPSAREMLELGAGAGTAACCVLADLREAQLTAIEKQHEMAELLEQNLTANGFAERSRIIELDILDKQGRNAANLPVNHFDTVIANPPFFDSASGTGAPDPTKSASSHMPSGQLDDWVKLAAGSLKAGGEAIFIHAADSLPELIAANTLRFGNLTLLPIAPRPDKPATRILMRGIKGSRAPMTLLPPLVLHPETGNRFNPLPDAILHGQARLDW